MGNIKISAPTAGILPLATDKQSIEDERAVPRRFCINLYKNNARSRPFLRIAKRSIVSLWELADFVSFPVINGRVVELVLVFMLYLIEKRGLYPGLTKSQLSSLCTLVRIQYRIDKDENTESERPWLPRGYHLENM